MSEIIPITPDDRKMYVNANMNTLKLCIEGAEAMAQLEDWEAVSSYMTRAARCAVATNKISSDLAIEESAI